MAGQAQVTKKVAQRESATPERQETTSIDATEVAAELDDILDEIDSVLEENAEEFVKGYVQKGGE